MVCATGSMVALPAKRAAPPSRLPMLHMCTHRSSGRYASTRAAAVAVAAVAVAAAAGSGGGGALVDPTAGKRTVVVPPQLDASHLEDVRKAGAFGPRGVLLIGRSEADYQAVQRWFSQMEPGFVVSPCPAALLAPPGGATLRQAVESEGQAAATLPQRGWDASPADTPPVAFFSGMTGEEQVAVMEGWRENTGLEAPAFAAVTAATLDKPLSRLLADIVRAQAQQPPPGLDPEQVLELESAALAARGAGSASSSGSGGAAGPAGAAVGPAGAAGGAAAGAAGGGKQGGEQVLRSKLQDYVMLDAEGQSQSMSLEALKEQIQDKMRAKRAQQAAEDKRARKEGSQDETDRLRQALRSGKGGGKGGKGGKKQQRGGGGGGGGGGKGFGS